MECLEYLLDINIYFKFYTANFAPIAQYNKIHSKIIKKCNTHLVGHYWMGPDICWTFIQCLCMFYNAQLENDCSANSTSSEYLSNPTTNIVLNLIVLDRSRHFKTCIKNKNVKKVQKMLGAFRKLSTNRVIYFQ